MWRIHKTDSRTSSQQSGGIILLPGWLFEVCSYGVQYVLHSWVLIEWSGSIGCAALNITRLESRRGSFPGNVFQIGSFKWLSSRGSARTMENCNRGSFVADSEDFFLALGNLFGQILFSQIKLLPTGKSFVTDSFQHTEKSYIVDVQKEKHVPANRRWFTGRFKVPTCQEPSDKRSFQVFQLSCALDYLRLVYCFS